MTAPRGRGFTGERGVGLDLFGHDQPGLGSEACFGTAGDYETATHGFYQGRKYGHERTYNTQA
jgi:hypothetical protein